MLTEGHWLIVNIRVEKIRIWIPLPLFILTELLWQLIELMEFIGSLGVGRIRKYKEALKAMPVVLNAISCISEGGRFDLVDIDVAERNGHKVRIFIKVR